MSKFIGLAAAALLTVATLTGCAATAHTSLHSQSAHEADTGQDAAHAAPAGDTVYGYDTVSQTDVDVTVTGYTPNADATVAAWNQFNTPVQTGDRYDIVTVTIKDAGTKQLDDAGISGAGVRLVSSKGTIYNADMTIAPAPGVTGAAELGVLPPGVTASGPLVFQVPANVTIKSWFFEGTFVDVS